MRTDVVGTHEASDAVGKHQPACFGLDRRTTVAQIGEDFPGLQGHLARAAFIPPVEVVRVGDGVGLPVGSGEGHETTIDPTREEGKPFVCRSRSDQG